VVALTASLGSLATGCRIDEDNIRRWETTLHGPEKLQAVLGHDKYEIPLRVEAALSLIRMKPRGGRPIGAEGMVETFASMSPEARQPLLAALVPAMIAELKKPPPVVQAGQPAPPDPSLAFKDAAYALLTFERTVLITDEPLRAQLRAALSEWAMADFERRLENRTQTYGMEQLLRMLGPESVVPLPKLMTRDARNLDKMSTLVADLGSDATKESASVALVDIAKHVVSQEWVKVKTPQVEAANKASKLEPTPEQFKAQLDQYQDEELFRVLGSLKKVGGRAAIDFALGFAADKNQSEKRRVAALAAVEGKLDRKSAEDLKRIFEIARSESPPSVLDQAFRRIGELPREVVIEKLYETFKSENWRVRRAAASTALSMSKLAQVDEFLGRLPEGDGKGFAMPEAIGYGATIGDYKEGKPRDALKKWLGEGTPAQRTTAVSFYLTHGTPDDLATLASLERDGSRVPVCEADADCKWACYVPKESDPKERELRDIKTLGEYVTLCVVPAIKERAAEAAKKKDEPKPGGDAPKTGGDAPKSP